MIKTRESGIPWIGVLPAHWSCIRGKYVLRYVQKPVREDDGVITCFRDGEVTLEKMNSYTMTLRDGKNIAFADFGNTYIPYPPVAEQKSIAEYLDAKCAEIDAIIATKQEQVRVAEAYKKSLIFEYVTGKKEVEV